MSFVDPIFACDFYKTGHKDMYPEGTNLIYSNFTPRSNKHCVYGADKVLFFGLQGFIQQWLIDNFNEGFFKKSKEEVIAKYKRRMKTSIGGEFNTDHIASLHDLGYLPIEIKALHEGSLVGMKVPVLTVKNTLPEFFWVTNYLETLLSNELWKVITTATTSYEYRKVLTKWAKKTGSPIDFVDWQAHDFSLRGMSGMSDSASCAGHLVSFLGTDTIPAIDYLEKYYSGMDTFVGGSVPASEHSCMTANIFKIESDDELISEYKAEYSNQTGIENPSNREVAEYATIKQLLQKFDTGVVSIVSDSFDFWSVITNIASALKPVIMTRKENEIGLAKTVFRPDSGNPADVLCGIEYHIIEDEFFAQDIACRILLGKAQGDAEELISKDLYSDIFKVGDKFFECEIHVLLDTLDWQYSFIKSYTMTCWREIELTPEQKGAVECLWDTFGGTVTSSGYRVLDSHVGLIYGDSITVKLADEIMNRLEKKGFASCNVLFGVGSFSLQMVSRDVFGFAMKATYAEVNGKNIELFKDPKTDSGKKSAKGLLRVEYEDGEYVLYDQQTPEQETLGCLKTVFKDGKLVNPTTIAEIRERVRMN
jgi:nicotinamide phosphoribosyltransferase